MAYLAADTSTKRTFNLLIDIDDGDDADLRNGYVIDFAAYFIRFGLATPHMLSLVLCRNDVRRLNTSSAYALIKAELALLIRRWPALKHRALQAQIADSRLHICFTQAFVPNDGQF